MKNQCVFLIVISLTTCLSLSGFAQISVPGWNGQVLIDCESTDNWTVEYDNNSYGSLELVEGFINNAVQLNWDIGDGNWVQAKYTFPQPVDLSEQDIFGLSLRGSTSTSNLVSVMFADMHGVFFGINWDGINTITRWMKNLPIPRKMFYHFFTIPTERNTNEIDWSQIDRFFVVVKRPDEFSGGGSGRLAIDFLQCDRAADWTRQQEFFSIVTDNDAKNKAVSYVMSQQEATGMFRSWKEEPSPKAHLYDQALTLILLVREGEWNNGVALNQAAEKADNLAASINSYQYGDGHWPRTWNPVTGAVLVDDFWVGDQAWWIIALLQYYNKSNNASALAAAHRGVDWIINSNGIISGSTEGTVDIWWALMSTGFYEEAEDVREYLLSTVWDETVQYWWRGNNDPFVAMDAATWVGEFARTEIVGRPDMARAALGFVRRTLLTTDDSGFLQGFDGMGPVSVWCEGTAQFVSAGGQDAQEFLDMLLSLQRPDGGMPCSPDDWFGTCFGWLSSWIGLAPTAWLYFALTESPFSSVTFPTAVPGTQIEQPDTYVLLHNYPNPFNPSTHIRFVLPENSDVSLKVYDALGREIRTLLNERKRAGRHSVVWDGKDTTGRQVTNGLYFFRLQTGQYVKVCKGILLK